MPEAHANRESGVPLPPQDQGAEQSVLGALLLDSRFFDDIASVLESEDFYNHSHRLIYAAIRKLAAASQPVDTVTVSEYLDRNGELDDTGGLDYLAMLARNTPNVPYVRTYADIVRDHAIKRRLIETAHDIAADCYNPKGSTARELLEKAEQGVLGISDLHGRGAQGFVEAGELLGQVYQQFAALNASGTTDSLTGLATGFTKLDGMTLGLQPGELVIVAGRPSMGKSALVMNMAENIALSDGGRPVAVFSMEMTGQDIARRLLSSNSRVNAQALSTGRVSEADMQRVTSSMNILGKAPIHIDDSGGLNAVELASRARRLKREMKNLGLVVVDYLQLMQASDSAGENRATEISNMTRSLKALAKELQVPVVVLSQLNRKLEERPDRRPIMSDLRESGAIEQDADLIIFIYRDEMYRGRGDGGDGGDGYQQADDYKGNAEIIIGKQRNGPTGTIELLFKKEIVRFDNLAE